RWKLERLPMTDRIILEIAVYEILTVEDIPTSVSINEAVKLAKKFGTESSSSYINGVLSNFVKSL
ncbi:MAG: N utilization substance protein B, partial [Clostridiales bacterium]|nr:N utilization substance protein B [Clostridiales bacterium]